MPLDRSTVNVHLLYFKLRQLLYHSRVDLLISSKAKVNSQNGPTVHMSLAARAHVELSPATLTVLRGDEAHFTCTATTRWTVMVWQLEGRPALTISKENGVLPSVHSNLTAEKPPNSNGDSWTFILKNAQRHNQGQVTCDLQGIDRRTARLFVQGLYNVHICVCEDGKTICLCMLDLL